MNKIDVIIPVYNVEKYLKSCLDSLMAQSYKDFTIIAVDDHSRDRSYKILKEYKIKYGSKIILLQNSKNSGVGEAKRVAIEKSKAPYITFVDSDDLVHKDFIKTILEVMENNDVELAAAPNYYTFYTDTPRINLNSNIEKLNYKIYKNNNLGFVGGKITGITTPGKCYKRELFNNVNFAKDMNCDDFYITPRLLYNVKKCAVIKDKLYAYRKRIGSLSSNNNTEQEKVKAWRATYEFYKEKGINNKKYLKYFYRKARKVIIKELYYAKGDKEKIAKAYKFEHEVFGNNFSKTLRTKMEHDRHVVYDKYILYKLYSYNYTLGYILDSTIRYILKLYKSFYNKKKFKKI